MDNYISISDYLIINDKKVNNIVFINFLIILLIIVTLSYIFMFIKYDNFYINEGFVFDNKIVLYVENRDMKYIINSNYLYINDKKNKYKIYSVSEDNYNFNNKYFKEVKLSVNINDRVNYDYNVVDIKINIYHDIMFNYFFNKIRGKI